MLPAIDTTQFKNDLHEEYTDTLLITYLATITKTINEADIVADIHNFMNERTRHHKRFPFHMPSMTDTDLSNPF